MYFRDLVTDPSQLPPYEKQCKSLSDFVSECVRFLVAGFEAAQKATSGSPCYSHSTVLMLARHVIVALDGVSVLARQGCAENCSPLLRSAFEADLGLSHILAKDSQRRAIAYQIAHIHRRIKSYCRLDSTDDLGIALRKELQGDPFLNLLDWPTTDLKARVASLQKCFSDPAFIPVEKAWQEAKKTRKGKPKKKDPEWFSLFSGPESLRDLAIRHQMGSFYESLYRTWSENVHGTGGMDSIGPSEEEGANAIRPIRHPSGLESACGFAAQFTITATQKLVKAYAPEQASAFEAKYRTSLAPRYRTVVKGGLIRCPWRGAE
jgi:hypothetical protein